MTWCLFLLFFFNQEKSMNKTQCYTHIQKEYTFESNTPSHELDSDQINSAYSFSITSRTLDFLHVGFCSFIEKEQTCISTKMLLTSILHYSIHPNQTTQLRC